MATTTKKTATKKAASKKAATKRTASKKSSTKRGSTKKAATKKSAAKKGSAKKAATKKNKLGVKNSLANNINAHKKRGDSKTKKRSTVSKKQYKRMQTNWGRNK